MDHRLFLDAGLIILVGPPGSGQDRIVSQMVEVGLVGHEDVFLFSTTQIPSTPEQRGSRYLELNALPELCSNRLSSRRTVASVELWSVDDYDAFVDVVETLGDATCMVIMDISTDVVLKRLRLVAADPVDFVRLEDLIHQLDSGVLRGLGVPSVLASVLSTAIEGQDDW